MVKIDNYSTSFLKSNVAGFPSEFLVSIVFNQKPPSSIADQLHKILNDGGQTYECLEKLCKDGSSYKMEFFIPEIASGNEPSPTANLLFAAVRDLYKSLNTQQEVVTQESHVDKLTAKRTGSLGPSQGL